MADRMFSDPALAALYDTLCAEREDLGFYLPLVMSARSVLDVGCGTGLLLHRAREAGHTGRLCGLDPAEAMLAQARARCPDVDWVLGDAASAAPQGEFELVVMTGHAFQVLVEDAALRSTLAAIRSALTPDGRFVFETRDPLAGAWADWNPENVSHTTDRHGALLRSWHEVEAVDGETVTFTHTLAHPSWDGPCTSRSTLRFLGADALASFLAEAGLTITEQYGDWDGSPMTDRSPEIITFATRASPPDSVPGG